MTKWEATRRLLESQSDIRELWDGIRQEVEKNIPE
jgi:hypothetical protein